jgi:hypothetical protein
VSQSRYTSSRNGPLTDSYIHRYAVFPEHLEVITSSNLLKIVGNISGPMVVVEGRPRASGWAMVMPEKLNGDVPVSPNGKDDAGIVAELLRWVVGESDWHSKLSIRSTLNAIVRSQGSTMPSLFTDDQSIITGIETIPSRYFSATMVIRR